MSTTDKRLDEIARKLKEALDDIANAKKSGLHYNRYSVISNAITESWTMLHNLGESLDIYGTKKRAREEAVRERESRRRLPDRSSIDMPTSPHRGDCPTVDPALPAARPSRQIASRVRETQLMLPPPGGAH